MQKLLLAIFFILSFYSAFCQYKITGKVVGKDSKKPIAAASVFFSNSSKGTTTNEQGEFVLDNIPEGRYDLIVSCLSYETHVQNIQPSKITAPLSIELQTKANELKEVVVGGYVKEGWEQWGKFFLDNFIGQSSYAGQCTITNTEAIQFRNYKKQKLLKAYADETLIIENKALGYTIRYKMELFQYDFTTRILYYQGYPLFEEMESKRSKRMERWAAARQKVYYGSELHFMRSLFRNRITEEGFVIRKMVKQPNLEKQRVKALSTTSIIKENVGGVTRIERASWYKDSARYYDNILQQPDEKDIVSAALLSADSIAYAVNKTTAGVDFADYLHITYTRAIEDEDYLLQQHLNRKPMAPVSTLRLINNKPIEILASGLFYESLNLLHSGYWGWSEKMATMLPFDYWPGKK